MASRFGELERLAEQTRPRRELRRLLAAVLPYKFLPVSDRPAEMPRAVVERGLRGKRKISSYSTLGGKQMSRN